MQPGAVSTPIWGKMRFDREILAAASAEVVETLPRPTYPEFPRHEVEGVALAQASKTTTADYADAFAAALAARAPKDSISCRRRFVGQRPRPAAWCRIG